MYTEYFGFKELPFSIAPDPRFLFMSAQHREALAHLVYGINVEGGFVLLTGEVGTGKTTVCRCLLGQLPENTDIAFILNPKMSVEELLAAVCDELGIRYTDGNRSIKVFIDRINSYLLAAFAKGRKTVVILEEAQNLSTDVLEQVRLLTNLETDRQKLLKIIMIGQPELRDILSRPDMRQLSQRITARYHIGPLPKAEVSAYVDHRLSSAGVRRKLFPGSIINKLYRLSHGVPRVINVICDRALLGTYVQGSNSVDRKTLIRAAREVFGEKDARKNQRKGALMWVTAGLALIACGFVVAFTFYRGSLQSGLKRADVTITGVKGPEARKVDALNWLHGRSLDRSRETAYRVLFGGFNAASSEDNNNYACKEARAKGFDCPDEQTNLGESVSRALMHLNKNAGFDGPLLASESGRVK
jgi:general secretion pathway protein A